MKDHQGCAQFVCKQVHHWKRPFKDFLAAVFVPFAVRSILPSSSDWSVTLEAVRKHFLVANDAWPERIAFESDEEMIPGFGISVRELCFGSLLVEPLVFMLRDARRLAPRFRFACGGRSLSCRISGRSIGSYIASLLRLLFTGFQILSTVWSVLCRILLSLLDGCVSVGCRFGVYCDNSRISIDSRLQRCRICHTFGVCFSLSISHLVLGCDRVLRVVSTSINSLRMLGWRIR